MNFSELCGSMNFTELCGSIYTYDHYRNEKKGKAYFMEGHQSVLLEIKYEY